jgi:hypothetical protein
VVASERTVPNESHMAYVLWRSYEYQYEHRDSFASRFTAAGEDLLVRAVIHTVDPVCLEPNSPP